MVYYKIRRLYWFYYKILRFYYKARMRIKSIIHNKKVRNQYEYKKPFEKSFNIEVPYDTAVSLSTLPHKIDSNGEEVRLFGDALYEYNSYESIW